MPATPRRLLTALCIVAIATVACATTEPARDTEHSAEEEAPAPTAAASALPATAPTDRPGAAGAGSMHWAEATADVLNRPATGDSVAHAYQTVRELPRRARIDGGESWREQLRATLAEQIALGEETRLVPVVRPLDSVEQPNGVTITRYQYLREAGLYAELIRLEPSERLSPTPILLSPGHGDAGRDAMLGTNTGEADAYQAGAALALAEAGYAVYLTEIRSLESATPYPLGHLAFVRMMIAQRRTALGAFVADAMQAAAVIDQIEDQASEGIVLAGVSLGAMVSVLAGQQLDNVTGVVASGYLGSMDGRYLAGHSCTCVYVPGIAGIADVPDVLGALAPTPLAMVMGDADEYYPLADQQAAWPVLRAAYEGDAEESVRLFRHDGSHTWGADAFLDAVAFVMPTR
jgi:dienelactone hydrolase